MSESVCRKLQGEASRNNCNASQESRGEKRLSDTEKLRRSLRKNL